MRVRIIRWSTGNSPLSSVWAEALGKIMGPDESPREAEKRFLEWLHSRWR